MSKESSPSTDFNIQQVPGHKISQPRLSTHELPQSLLSTSKAPPLNIHDSSVELSLPPIKSPTSLKIKASTPFAPPPTSSATFAPPDKISKAPTSSAPFAPPDKISKAPTSSAPSDKISQAPTPSATFAPPDKISPTKAPTSSDKISKAPTPSALSDKIVPTSSATFAVSDKMVPAKASFVQSMGVPENGWVETSGGKALIVDSDSDSSLGLSEVESGMDDIVESHVSIAKKIIHDDPFGGKINDNSETLWSKPEDISELKKGTVLPKDENPFYFDGRAIRYNVDVNRGLGYEAPIILGADKSHGKEYSSYLMFDPSIGTLSAGNDINSDIPNIPKYSFICGNGTSADY